ncbi:uncharacterized protein LOC143896664 isoform X2 [Temnothorax americanus]
MPACYVHNCKSRTDCTYTRNIKLFRFPKELTIRQQWLEACRRNEKEIKIDSARICNLHFEEDCFEMKWTKPRSTNIPKKQMCRLKKNSIPTLMLNVEQRRRKTRDETDIIASKKIKLAERTSMSTNTELLKCIQGKQLIKIHKDVSNSSKDTKQQKDAKERFESGDIFESNVAEKESTTNEIIVHKTDQNKETLLRLLKKAEEEKNKLLEER